MNLYTTGFTLLAWAKAMYGDIALSKEERAKRFFEEACELAQATGLNEQDCSIIATRTFNRPKDEVFKEVGGIVTLLNFCAAWEIDPEMALHVEMRRIISKPESHWRDKHNAKVEAGTTVASAGIVSGGTVSGPSNVVEFKP